MSGRRTDGSVAMTAAAEPARTVTRAGRELLSRATALEMAVIALLLAVVVTGALAVAVVDAQATRLRTVELDTTTLFAELLSQRVAIDDILQVPPATPDAAAADRALSGATLRALHDDTAGTDDTVRVGRMAAAAAAWQRWADGVSEELAAGSRPTAAETAEGERLFDAYDQASDDLTAEIDVDARQASTLQSIVTAAAGFVILVAFAIGTTVLLHAARRFRRLSLDPIQDLAGAAALIARGGQTPIPHVGRRDPIGVLAGALRDWRDATLEREILIDHAPVGICRVDGQQRMIEVNVTMAAMLGYTKEDLTNRSILEINPPEDHGRSRSAHAAFMAGKRDVYTSERRWVRKDGTQIWCSLRVAPVRAPGGENPVSLIAISEDITERRRSALQAAQIQRQLLPRETPALEGYDLAGACLPAQDVAGDFYDWVITDDGHLDLTLADVMGKGVAAALVMATVRATLRAAPPGFGPLARARVAAQSLALGIADEGVFVTLFHCRIHLATGALRYVDAGHGYCAIRRPDGELVRLEVCSMPLGVTELSEMREGTGWLEPGDTLVVFSDGLVEMPERTAELAEFSPDFESAAGAADTVVRMMARTPTQPDDDVTLVVLRRLGGEVVPLRIPAELPPRARPPDQRSAASSSS